MFLGAKSRNTIIICLILFAAVGVLAADVPTLKIQTIDEKPWWLDSSIQSLGIFITACFVVWQIKKQREGAINVEKLKFKNDINFKIYEKISTEISAAQKYNFTNVIRLPERILNAKDKEEAITAELNFTDDEYKRAFDQALKVLSILEDYEIVLTDLSVFKVVICTMLDDLMEKHFDLRKYVQESKQELVGVGIPTATVNGLQSACGGLYECWLDFSSYLFDLSIECQNKLLGDIYQTQIKPRKPLDPRYKAITSNAKEVVEFFKHNEKFMARWAEHTARYGEQKIQSS